MKPNATRYRGGQLLILAVLAVILQFALTGCSGLTPQPQTPQERVYVAQSTLTGVYKAIAELTTSGALTADEHERYLMAADKAETNLGTAKRLLSQGLPDDALTLLQLTNTLLLELQTQLQERQP